MVSMHFGTEYTFKQTLEQEQIANFLASLGVDIIIGHHPHVVEPITFINNTLVIYSLGNFISGQDTINRLTGVMVGIDVKKENNKISLDNLRAILTYTKKNNGYEVIPYHDLTDDILPNKIKYEEEYQNVLTSLGTNISFE